MAFVAKEGEKGNCYLKCPTAGLLWKTGSLILNNDDIHHPEKEGILNLEQQLNESSNNSLVHHTSIYK